MTDKDHIKVNTYTEHEMTVVNGIIKIPKGTVVTGISICEKGGCTVYYRRYVDCPLEKMLIDGGIAIYPGAPAKD